MNKLLMFTKNVYLHKKVENGAISLEAFKSTEIHCHVIWSWH